MSIKLLLQALVKFVLGLVSFFLLLFLPAGTLRYWNGWLLMGLLFVPMLLLGVFLWVKQPELLQSWLSLLCMLPLPIILAKRIQNEEEVLKNGLAGYEDYMRRVKFRLIPFVW